MPPPLAAELEAAEGASGDRTPRGQASLIVRAGDGAARVIDLTDGDVVAVGRAPESTVCVDDPRVSRNHARIARRGHALELVDLWSRNGTSVNGAAVRGAERGLAGGDVIRIGPAERALRPREGRVHRGGSPQDRLFRGGAGRHVAARRDRRAERRGDIRRKRS